MDTNKFELSYLFTFFNGVDSENSLHKLLIYVIKFIVKLINASVTFYIFNFIAVAGSVQQ